MPEGSAAGRARTPMHLWILGVVALLWNGFGAFDYTMTQTRNMDYLKMLTPEQQAFVFAFPAWSVAAWALGVWGGVVGAVLLLARKRAAAPVFLVSLVGAAVSHLYMFAFSDYFAVMGGGGAAILPAVIITGAILLYLYARNMANRGVLQ
jgi:hypothetical protein